jgi:hypothetical protein
MEPAVRSPRIKSAIITGRTRNGAFGLRRPPKFPTADRHWPSKPCRRERNFWMQRREAKNRPERPQGSPETERGKRYRPKSPQKRPIRSRRMDLRFRRTGWWCAQSSETGLEHRNREFFGNFRPKQAFARLQAASHWKFLSDPRQLHGHRGTFLLFCKTGVRNAKTGRLERKIRSLNPPNRWWPADSKRVAIPPPSRCNRLARVLRLLSMRRGKVW